LYAFLWPRDQLINIKNKKFIIKCRFRKPMIKKVDERAST